MQKVPTTRASRLPRRAARVAVLAAICGALLRTAGACVFAGLLVRSAYATEAAAPTILRAGVPGYPDQARRYGLEGTVHLRVRVLADGQPGEVRVYRSSGARELDEAAVAAAAGSTFSAARNAEGASVEAWVIVPYKFVLEDAPKPEARRPILYNAPEAP
jgi:TonB family protein